jgi:hypothetical protein
VLIAARHAYAGSVKAHLLGLGAMAFLTYNYVIFCFSVTFGPLFLLWTAAGDVRVRIGVARPCRCGRC